MKTGVEHVRRATPRQNHHVPIRETRKKLQYGESDQTRSACNQDSISHPRVTRFQICHSLSDAEDGRTLRSAPSRPRRAVLRPTASQHLHSGDRRHRRAERARQTKGRRCQQEARSLVCSQPVVQVRQAPQLAKMDPELDQATSVDRKPGKSRKVFLARLLKGFDGEIVSDGTEIPLSSIHLSRRASDPSSTA